MKYVKLLDGAITDNFGVTGFSIARARSRAYAVIDADRSTPTLRISCPAASMQYRPDPDAGSSQRGIRPIRPIRFIGLQNSFALANFIVQDD